MLAEKCRIREDVKVVIVDKVDKRADRVCHGSAAGLHVQTEECFNLNEDVRADLHEKAAEVH